MHIKFIGSWKALVLAATLVGLALAPLTVANAAGQPFGKTPASEGRGDENPSDNGANQESAKPGHDHTVFPRANYLWPFAAGPAYGEIQSSRWGDRGILHTAVGSFDTHRGLSNIPGELRTVNKLHRGGFQYFFLQVDPASFGDGVFDRIREGITSRGGAFVQEMPVAAFVVRLNLAAYSAVQSESGILFLEPYHPAFKLHPTLGRVPLPDPQKALSDVWTLEVNLFDGENSATVAQAIAQLGGNVLSAGGDVIRVELNRQKLANLAAIEGIQQVFEALPITVHSQEQSSDVQTGIRGSNVVANLAYNNAGVDGGGNGIASNQILMVLDTGIQYDNGDLSDTRTSAAVPSSTHRKVSVYADAALFGGDGDLLGCDSLPSGGYTHGHTVSAVALGNATNVLPAYGGGWIKNDPDGNPWRFDGIAPKAKLISYDAQNTPASLGCDDTIAGQLVVGNLYARGVVTSPGWGSLKDSFNQGARQANFSWGVNNVFGVYGTNASNIDKFLFDNPMGMVFVAAGNSGGDTDQNGIPDEFLIADPATCKSCVTVGMSDVSGTTNRRHPASSVGPATVASDRIAPILMAPGTDSGAPGFAESASCRSISNGQADAVDCSTTQAHIGTSFSSPAAAGAALLVRDYFAQGFLPDGTSTNAGNSTELFS
ncbi:MAG: S8 family serine peptidase, partial [Candidatus Methylomirabilis sp.]